MNNNRVLIVISALMAAFVLSCGQNTAAVQVAPTEEKVTSAAAFDDSLSDAEILERYFWGDSPSIIVGWEKDA